MDHTPARILVVDDEPSITEFVSYALQKENYTVDTAGDGEQALTLIEQKPYDLYILDIMLPGIDGYELCRRIRASYDTPILFLSARDGEVNKIIGLELGADDYLPKPFNDRELVARIRAILRRSHWSEQQQNNDNGSPTLEVDALSLNPGRQEATFDGQTLELTGTEFTLLYLLAQHLGQVVSREHLSQEVLGKRLTPFDRAIDMHISNLRRKLPDRKDGHPWFKTLRGRGYLMVSAS